MFRRGADLNMIKISEELLLFKNILITEFSLCTILTCNSYKYITDYSSLAEFWAEIN